MNGSPIWAQASAKAMLVEPLEASITGWPARNSPRRHALSKMYRAIRSLVDPLGFRNSSLHQTVTPSIVTGTKGVGASCAA